MLEWGLIVSQPSPLVSLFPSPHLLHSCKPPLWLREERPLSKPSILHPFPGTRADGRSYQNIKKKKRKKRRKKEKKKSGVGGREQDPLVVGNKSQTLRAEDPLQSPLEHADPKLLPKPATYPNPSCSPSAKPPAPLQPWSSCTHPETSTGTLFPFHPQLWALSPPPTQDTATFLLSVLHSHLAVLPLNHNTSIQHMPLF